VAELLHLEAELRKALRKCNRDLRSRRKSIHSDCCPVLEELEENSGPSWRGSSRS